MSEELIIALSKRMIDNAKKIIKLSNEITEKTGTLLYIDDPDNKICIAICYDDKYKLAKLLTRAIANSWRIEEKKGVHGE